MTLAETQTLVIYVLGSGFLFAVLLTLLLAFFASNKN